MNVEEIRAMRIEESKRTINMSLEELLEYSKSKGGEFMQQALENKKQKDKSKVK